MLNDVSTNLLMELESGLQNLTEEIESPLERLVQSLKLIRHYLDRLKQAILEFPFDDEAEEIRFFKYVKPSFYNHHIFCTEMYTIESSLPIDAEKQKAFLEDEISYVERYFKKYAFLYQYYKMDANELDNIFFVRGKEIQTMLLPNVPEHDPSFSTMCDYLFAKFKAFDRLKNWITEKLASLKGTLLTDDISAGSGLSWTGDSIDLLENAYGWYYTGQINNGNAGIGEIVRMLEKVLCVTIGKPGRRLAEIKQRKRVSKTQYLDQMKSAISKKLYDDDEYIHTNKPR